MSSGFEMVKNGGVKKASLYVHFEGLTTDSYFGKTRPPGERSDRKKGFFNTLLMRKHHFWHVQWFEMVKNGGLKKHLSMSILKVWQLTLTLAKQDPLGRDQIEKKGFFNTLLMRKHHFWHVQWFWNGQKWGVKKASLYVHFEGLTTDSYFGKTRPPGERPPGERSDRKKGLREKKKAF